MKTNTRKLTLYAILTAIVIVLQFMGAFIRFGPFSVTLVLIPIVVGAATCGPLAGAWLGFVFGIVVLLSGDASAFLSVDAFSTVLTVLLKGTMAGWLAGLTYKVLERFNAFLATLAAAIVCPVVNTALFWLGCNLFFMPTITEWAGAEGMSAASYLIVGMIGVNFLLELGANILLSPAIVRILKIRKK